MQAIAPATRKSYSAAMGSLCKFCEQQNLAMRFPVSADTICLWMADASQRLTYSTIRVYLHGIATTLVELGQQNPLADGNMIWRMFRAIKRLQGSPAAKQRLPITVEHLRSLERWQEVTSVRGLALRAAMWMGTCGLMRSGEFAMRTKHSELLRLRHVTFMTEGHERVSINSKADAKSVGYVTVHIPSSKTDPFRAGVDVIISQDEAIAALTDYLLAAHAAGVHTQEEQPLLSVSANKPLEVGALVAHTQELCNKAGLADAHMYAGHSFRRGGATSLHMAGIPDSMIRIMGRWKSFAFARYVDTPVQRIIEAGKALATKGRHVTFGITSKSGWTGSSIWG